MRTTGTMAAALTVLLAVAGCSSGSSKVLVQDTPTPLLSGPASAAASPAATSPAPAATRRAKARHATTSAAPTAGTTTTRTSSPKPAPTHSTTTSSPKQTASTSTGCTTTGSTTTIRMVTGDKFTPSTVSINRCDAVKAVYADTTGVPHNWQGKGWMSPDMTSAGQSYTYRFPTAGSFNFFCSYHQSVGMTGTVTVH